MEIEERRDGSIVLSGELARRFKIVGAGKIMNLIDQQYAAHLSDRRFNNAARSAREIEEIHEKALHRAIDSLGIHRVIGIIDERCANNGQPFIAFTDQDGPPGTYQAILHAVHNQGLLWLRDTLSANLLSKDGANAAQATQAQYYRNCCAIPDREQTAPSSKDPVYRVRRELRAWRITEVHPQPAPKTFDMDLQDGPQVRMSRAWAEYHCPNPGGWFVQDPVENRSWYVGNAIFVRDYRQIVENSVVDKIDSAMKDRWHKMFRAAYGLPVTEATTFPSKDSRDLSRCTPRERAMYIATKFAAYVDRSPFTTDEIDAAVALFSTLRCLSGAPV